MPLTILATHLINNATVSGNTSTVSEPSVAERNNEILLTGNWYAANTVNNGASWQHLDPYTFFPTTAGGFCCDQTVINEPDTGLLVWLLQYKQSGGSNVLRLAVNTGVTANISDWHWWDLVPHQINAAWIGEWFDYNHAALSNNFLYIVTNVFRGNSWTRAVVFRLSLNELRTGGHVNFNYFETQQNGSLRCTQGATDTMYFAAHNSNSVIRIFTWPENVGTASYTDVNITRWTGGSGYTSICPDGTNWLSRTDRRITGGWFNNNIVGFMWTVDAGSRPHPHIRVVRIDVSNSSNYVLLDEPDIWHNDYAYAYPDASPNDNGDVGISLFRGGGTINPGHVVGVLDNGSNRWTLQGTRNGTNGPNGNKWGDYVTCRNHSNPANSWIAAGFTLQGGSARSNIEPCVVHFHS